MSQLFDESNYDVACVLRHLPLLVRLYAETEQGRENSAYYLTLSQQICVYIGAVNDENHLITLKMLSIYERLDIDDKIAAALSQPRVRHSYFPHRQDRSARSSSVADDRACCVALCAYIVEEKMGQRLPVHRELQVRKANGDGTRLPIRDTQECPLAARPTIDLRCVWIHRGFLIYCALDTEAVLWARSVSEATPRRHH